MLNGAPPILYNPNLCETSCRNLFLAVIIRLIRAMPQNLNREGLGLKDITPSNPVKNAESKTPKGTTKTETP